jgi:cytochrome c-type biogenesis protein
MATSDVRDEKLPTRGILIGLALALGIGAVGVLAFQSSGATAVNSPSTLVLAPAAFIAGVFSFLSPCTLPILPAYFAFTFQARRERIVLMSIAFFLGLATTVVLFGATATALSRALFDYKEYITWIGGALIIVFGVMSVFGKGFTGVQLLDRPTATLFGSYIYGATFAVGWSACIGPIFGALLTLLTTQGIAVVQGALLAFIYAFGLGMPLIVIATFFSRLGRGSRFWTFIKGRPVTLNLGVTTLELHSTSLISGLLLIVMGALLMTGQVEALGRWAQATPMGQWALDIENGIERVFFGN